MSKPGGVFWDPQNKCHMIALILDPDEARNIALALGHEDTGARQLEAWADEAEACDCGPLQQEEEEI